MGTNRFADTPGEAAEQAARRSRALPGSEKRRMLDDARARLKRTARYRPRSRKPGA